MRFTTNMLLLASLLLFFSCENINMDATKIDKSKTITVPSNPAPATTTNESSTYVGIVNGGTLTMMFINQSLFITYAVNNQTHKAIYKLSDYGKRTPIPPAPCTPIVEGCPPRLEELEGVIKNNRISLDSYPEFFKYLYFSYDSGSEAVGKLLDNSTYKVSRVQ